MSSQIVEAENQLYQRMARLQEERRRALVHWTFDLHNEDKRHHNKISTEGWRRIIQSARLWLMHPLIDLRVPSSTNL